MMPLRKIVACSAATLLLAANTTSLAGASTEAPKVQLVCQGGLPDPVCKALAGALAHVSMGSVQLYRSTDEAQAQGGLIVEFIQENRSADSLSGHLVWRGASVQAGNGPTMELSIMDASLDDEAVQRFAAYLIEYSKLPL